MHTSVDDTGKPMVPLKLFKLDGLIVTQGEVSVSPYASSNGARVISCHFSATTLCTDMPPPRARCSSLKSSFVNSEFFNKALKSVFTPVMEVNLNFFSS